MQYEVVFLQRHTVTIDCPTLACAQAVVACWVSEMNTKPGSVSVLSVGAKHARREQLELALG